MHIARHIFCICLVCLVFELCCYVLLSNRWVSTSWDWRYGKGQAWLRYGKAHRLGVEGSDLVSLKLLERVWLCAAERTLRNWPGSRVAPSLSCHNRSACDYLCIFLLPKAVGNAIAPLRNLGLLHRARNSYEHPWHMKLPENSEVWSGKRV